MFSNTIRLFVLLLLTILWRHPEAVGVWEAKKDIAYETYMGEHYDDN
jgi:hypothetical protein